MRTRVFLLLGAVALSCLVAAFLRSRGRDREVQSHLRRYEYWERLQFGGKGRWTDPLATGWWGLRSRPDPNLEWQKERDSLVALGYLVKHSFVLLAPLTNRADNISFVRTIRGAKVPDPHWSFAQFSNRIDAVICTSDLPLWEQVIRTWDSQRVTHRLP